MFSAKQWNYWYHFYKYIWYDAVLDRGLNPGLPALEASTIPFAEHAELFKTFGKTEIYFIPVCEDIYCVYFE